MVGTMQVIIEVGLFASMVFIIGIHGIVCELLASQSRLSFLLSALLFVVAEFSTVPAFDWAVLMAWSNRMAPPLPNSL